MFGIGRRRQRRQLLDGPFPVAWTALLEQNLVHWSLLDDDEQSRLEDLIRRFMTDKKWQSSRQFDLTDEIRVLISAMACLLILELEYDYYESVKWIEVHPTTVTRLGTRGVGVAGVVTDAPMPILGEASFTGPVVVAWDAADAGARHPERGHNVVYHEFAHKLDMDDRLIDGTPRLVDEAARRRWIEVCTAEFEALRRGEGGPLLDPYGGVNPGEFFAVATELFFDRPVAMRQAKPDLYDVLRGFYLQDPAEREQGARHRRG